ncbi:MAG: dienelactone hydrolase family protein [Candidatus Sericytochromatia bacterium]
MSIQTRTIEYHDGETLLEGHLAWDNEQTGPRPGILVAHAWGGRDEFACGRAEDMARLGYVGFALDMFGKGVLGHSTEENSALITPFMQDRGKMQQRMHKALEVARQQEEIDASQMGAMGFCFGGMCVLDLARSGADIQGAISVHGLLSPPGNIVSQITAKVLVLHGYKDTMAKPEDLAAIQQELQGCEADWQSHCYGQAWHAFTNPHAHDFELGTVYNERAAARAWKTIQDFWTETF